MFALEKAGLRWRLEEDTRAAVSGVLLVALEKGVFALQTGVRLYYE